jgi:hypothetical protein
MSASGVREKLRTVAGVQEVAKVYYDITLTDAQAALLVMRFDTTSRHFGWTTNPDAVSAGPLIALKNRMRAMIPDIDGGAEDDALPLAFVSRGSGRKRELRICAVARSKMFRTVRLVFPIDLTAARVTVRNT